MGYVEHPDQRGDFRGGASNCMILRHFSPKVGFAIHALMFGLVGLFAIRLCNNVLQTNRPKRQQVR